MSKDKKRGPLTPEDESLWEAVTETVKPLEKQPQERTDLGESNKDKSVSKSSSPSRIAPTSHAVQSKNTPTGSSDALDRDISRKLRRGQLTLEATIDLHGMTQNEAWQYLLHFIERSYVAGKRCLLVITGKGRGGAGILKQQLPMWLETAAFKDKISTYSLARPQDGGGGAYYVILKRRR